MHEGWSSRLGAETVLLVLASLTDHGVVVLHFLGQPVGDRVVQHGQLMNLDGSAAFDHLFSQIERQDMYARMTKFAQILRVQSFPQEGCIDFHRGEIRR
jgi:hypothetical protein